MSAIDKKPFIVQVLDTLTAEQAATLQNLINGEGADPVLRSLVPQSPYALTVSDKGVKSVTLEVSGPTSQRLYNGYLIYNDTYCVLISYSGVQNQNLTLIDMVLDGTWSYKIKGCILKIGELRSELNDILIEKGEAVSIQVGDIDSESSTAGKVIMSDGEGGAEWGNLGDIISKIEMEYLAGDNLTIVDFPKGVMPTSITFNTHELFIKDFSYFVDRYGNSVEGYQLEYYGSEGDHYQMQIAGDISEQVINNLTYLSFDAKNGVLPRRVGDSLILYNPSLYSGTRLYKHTLKKSNNEWTFSVISTSPDRWENNDSTLATKLISGLVSMTVMFGVAQFSSYRGIPYDISNTGGSMTVSYLSLGDSITPATLVVGTSGGWSDTVTEL